MYKKPYIVYWEVLTDDQWKAKLEEYKAEQAKRKMLEARAVDRVEIGQAASERGHDLKGEKTGAGEFAGMPWRHAADGGWFSLRFKVLPDQPMELLCTYWGSDGGSRTFDILVDGTKIATEKLANNRPGKFYDQAYAIPPDLTKGRDGIVVINIISPVESSKPTILSYLYSTYSSVFRNVAILPLGDDPKKLQNAMLIASDRDLSGLENGSFYDERLIQKTEPLSDEKNPIDVLVYR
jgi:hypothetical protein